MHQFSKFNNSIGTDFINQFYSLLISLPKIKKLGKRKIFLKKPELVLPSLALLAE